MERKRNIQKKKAKSSVFIQKKDVIPRPICIETAQKTVPIVGVHEKYGLIETYKGCYVKSYLIGDNNYLTAPEEEQNVYYRGWKKVLNSFGSNVEFALTFNNRSINMTDFFESVLIKETGDEFDHLRKQMNTIIVDRMQDGKNGIQKDKYLTVAVHTDKPKKAGEVFRRLDRDLHKSLVKIGSYAKVIPLEERLEILFALYNDSDEHLITRSRVIDEDGRTREVKSFDYRNMRSMGLEINDLIAPTSFDIEPEHIQMGNKFSRTLRVTNLPSQLNDEFINSATYRQESYALDIRKSTVNMNTMRM